MEKRKDLFSSDYARVFKIKCKRRRRKKRTEADVGQTERGEIEMDKLESFASLIETFVYKC